MSFLMSTNQKSYIPENHAIHARLNCQKEKNKEKK